MANATRKKSKYPIFGAPEELPTNVLPTYLNVMKYYNEVKRFLACTKKNYNPSFTEIAENVTNEIEELWVNAFIPTVSHNRTIQLLRSYHEKSRTLLKPYQKRKENDNYLAKLQSFQIEALRLFDIYSCKCADISQCLCPCKVLTKQVAFLVDQKTCRKNFNGKVDAVESKRLENLGKRKIANEILLLKRKQSTVSSDENRQV